MAALIALGGVLVIPASPAGAAEGDGSDVLTTRYGGPDRYATSLLIAEAFAEEAGGSLEWAVLVSGQRWTDAVVAAPVAGALGAPVLMTPPDELRADASEFLRRVGVTNALVVGPDASGGAHGPGRGVSADVLEALEDAGVSAQRVAGDDRYSTGVVAAGRVTPGIMPGLGRTAIVASGEVFADALVAGPFAARGGHPVLLTPPGELHTDISGYLAANSIEHVVLMGGSAALSGAVETSIGDLGANVTRLAGATRYDTAVKAAQLVTDRYSVAASQTCFATSTIGVARARVPFDSFSAAPLLARLCAPLVLADPDEIPADTAAYLDAARDAHEAVGLRVFGGNAAVSQNAIDAYLTGMSPDVDAEAADDAADADAAAADGAAAADDEAAEAEPVGLQAGTCGGSITDESRQLIDSTNAEDPDWSPDCSQIVYTQNGSLWIANNDGTESRQLVPHDGRYLYQADWSLDATKIVYVVGFRNDADQWNSHIWTVNSDGTRRSKLTKGDTQDNWPAWSPDGTTIVFERATGTARNDSGWFENADRYVATVGPEGGKVTALTAGDNWEQVPTWSPDGTQLAFTSNASLYLADADGMNRRIIMPDVYWAGGLSFSPDGRRIAFTRGDNSSSSIRIADLSGLDEQIVADPGIRTLAPRWSPDGQLLAFHTIDGEGLHRTYVAGASGEAVTGGARECRPRGLGGTTAGFPLPDWVPSTGTVRIGVLFMDFPDAQAAHTTQEEAEKGLAWSESYLEAVSYGKLDVEFVPLHRWLRAEQESAVYIGPTATGEGLVGGASAHAVALADDEVDFSSLDLVLTVFPGSHFSGGNALGEATADDVTVTTTRVNTAALEETRPLADWGYTAAHEIAHNLGLLDMYPYDFDRHELSKLPEGSVWAFVDMGLMGLRAQFRAQSDDERFRILWRFPNGNSSSGSSASFNVREMLGWSRWQLGWLDPAQVHCDSGAGATVSLAPIAQPGNAVALAVVPSSAHEMIVIESRRKSGYDTGRVWVDHNTNARTTFPGLVTEGVLVYTVDTFTASGDLPVMVAGDSGNSQIADFPTLEVGDSVTVSGYTITVTADDGSTHTVSITRSS